MMMKRRPNLLVFEKWVHSRKRAGHGGISQWVFSVNCIEPLRPETALVARGWGPVQLVRDHCGYDGIVIIRRPHRPAKYRLLKNAYFSASFSRTPTAFKSASCL